MQPKKIMAIKMNKEGKALKTYLASVKDESIELKREYEIAFQTNGTRPENHVYNQSELKTMFPRVCEYDDTEFVKTGASKCTWLGIEGVQMFKHIVVKRALLDSWTGRGNQLLDEIHAYITICEDSNASDYLCPILKYFTSKSDKVKACSEKMLNNVIIIQQKAVYVGSAWGCTHEAERLNTIHGLKGENAEKRYNALERFTVKNRWYDTLDNGGNSGVIYDYSKNCYKAVFIDYAL